MFTFYILTIQVQRLWTLVLALGPLLKGPFDLVKLCKVIELVFFMALKVLAIFIIAMGIVSLVVIRTIWKFK